MEWGSAGWGVDKESQRLAVFWNTLPHLLLLHLTSTAGIKPVELWNLVAGPYHPLGDIADDVLVFGNRCILFSGRHRW